MRLLVCVKIISADLIFSDVNRKRAINPYDVFALLEANKLRDEHTEIICLIMGKTDDRIAAELKYLGADRVIFTCDPEFAGADTVATTLVLWKAILKIGNIDLIFCGDHAVDGETGHVAPGLAQRLGYTYLGNADYCYRANGICCSVGEGDYRLTYSVESGSVVSFANSITKPISLPLPLLRQIHAVEYDEWSLAFLDIKKEQCGLNGSKTKVIRTRPISVDYTRSYEEIDARFAKLFLQGGYKGELSLG